MKKLSSREIRIEWIKKDNTFHRKLERIITRNFWGEPDFDGMGFHIYCKAVRYEAELLKYDGHLDENPFIGSEEYRSLVKMSDDRLRKYLSGLNKSQPNL